MQSSLFAQQSLFGTVQDNPSSKTANNAGAGQKTLLSEVVFTVLDLETTGLSAKKNAITEVTAIQYQNNQEVGKYSTLIKPAESIPEEVELLTGITNEMVRQAPALVMVMSELAGFLGNSSVIVGHNIAFDIGFLKEKFTETGLGTFMDRLDLSRALCTRVLAKKALPGLPSYEGIMVATSVGVYNPNPHRAESDVRMSAGILFAIIERLKEAGTPMNTLGDLWAYQGQLTER